MDEPHIGWTDFPAQSSGCDGCRCEQDHQAGEPLLVWMARLSLQYGYLSPTCTVPASPFSPDDSGKGGACPGAPAFLHARPRETAHGMESPRVHHHVSARVPPSHCPRLWTFSGYGIHCKRIIWTHFKGEGQVQTKDLCCQGYSEVWDSSAWCAGPV